MPLPWITKTKSKPDTVSLQAQVSIAIFCVSFCQGKQPVWNDIRTKRVSTGPSIVFELRPVTRTESECKNLLISCHVTRLMAALQDNRLRVFKKVLYLALLWLMDYRNDCEINLFESLVFRSWRRNLDFVCTSGNGQHLLAFPTKPR